MKSRVLYESFIQRWIHSSRVFKIFGVTVFSLWLIVVLFWGIGLFILSPLAGGSYNLKELLSSFLLVAIVTMLLPLTILSPYYEIQVLIPFYSLLLVILLVCFIISKKKSKSEMKEIKEITKMSQATVTSRKGRLLKLEGKFGEVEIESKNRLRVGDEVSVRVGDNEIFVLARDLIKRKTNKNTKKITNY